MSRLIYGEQVELRTAHKIDPGRLVCEVYFRNTNLAAGRYKPQIAEGLEKLLREVENG